MELPHAMLRLERWGIRENLVDATGIEPVTPTMSTLVPSASQGFLSPIQRAIASRSAIIPIGSRHVWVQRTRAPHEESVRADPNVGQPLLWRTVLILLALSLLMLFGMTGAYFDLHIGHD